MKKKRSSKFPAIFLTFLLVIAVLNFLGTVFPFSPVKYQIGDETNKIATTVAKVKDALIGIEAAPVDKVLYDQKMLALANNPPVPASTSTASSTHSTSTPKYLWPPKSAVYPLTGAILPFNRIVAYYGNFYSKGMGVLGQYPPEEMLSRLKAEVEKWQQADPATPVVPAIHYITVTAQGLPGADGKYRLRMPDDQIDKALQLASEVNGLVFLDIQVGQSDLPAEIPHLDKYLRLPNVHLAIDPEFSMKHGEKPGTVIGIMDATDVNYAADYLARLVREGNLPPKILIVHRFTEGMVTNYQNIRLQPEVQIVMDMDGWGPQAKKIGTYKQVIYPYPIQFTGFKLFYRNDTVYSSSTMLAPKDLLKLRPIPSYI